MNLLTLSLILCGFDAVVRPIFADVTSDSPTSFQYQCGTRKRFGIQLIHGGHSAELGQWPWHAALFHGANYKCGATLIDQRHVLTSAHCVVDWNRRAKKPKTITIHLGKNVLDENPKGQVQNIKISEIHLYPEFSTNRHDIALLVLAQSVQLSEYVNPICIEGIQAKKIEDLVGRRGWVAGFGETENGNLSNQLKTISMPVVNATMCVQSDPEVYARLIAPSTFCAGDRNGTSICRGDAGNGLYILDGDQWELRGIASFSRISDTGSCDNTSYAGFTNVAYYYEWIKRLITVKVKQEV